MKNFEFREIGGNETFDPSILCVDVPFTQASFYGDWQKSLGRKTRRFIVCSDKEIVAYFQLIKYPLLVGKSYFYIPYGPITKDFSKEFFYKSTTLYLSLGIFSATGGVVLGIEKIRRRIIEGNARKNSLLNTIGGKKRNNGRNCNGRF